MEGNYGEVGALGWHVSPQCIVKDLFWNSNGQANNAPSVASRNCALQLKEKEGVNCEGRERKGECGVSFAYFYGNNFSQRKRKCMKTCCQEVIIQLRQTADSAKAKKQQKEWVRKRERKKDRVCKPHAMLCQLLCCCCCDCCLKDYIALMWFYNMSRHKNEKLLPHMPQVCVVSVWQCVFVCASSKIGLVSVCLCKCLHELVTSNIVEISAKWIINAASIKNITMQQSGNANFHQQTVKQIVKWTCTRKVKNCITVISRWRVTGFNYGCDTDRDKRFGSDFGLKVGSVN